MFYAKEKRHFRGHKTKIKGKRLIHPSYIVGEDKARYAYFGLTHSSKKGKGHGNHHLKTNPKTTDSAPSYMRKKLEWQPKRSFTSWKLDGYRMSPEDDEYVDLLIHKAIGQEPRPKMEEQKALLISSGNGGKHKQVAAKGKKRRNLKKRR